MTEPVQEAVAPEAAEGVSTQAPEPEPHEERGGQPFYQRAFNARALAHEELQKAKSEVQKWFTTGDQE